MTSSSHGLLEKRVVVVTGKGGVGKTTVALALGAEAARRGRRTLVAELSGSHQAPGRFDQQGRGYEILELAPDLFTMSITPQEAIEDYVVQQLRFRWNERESGLEAPERVKQSRFATRKKTDDPELRIEQTMIVVKHIKKTRRERIIGSRKGHGSFSRRPKQMKLR